MDIIGDKKNARCCGNLYIRATDIYYVVGMKKISIDEDAHKRLVDVKEKMQQEGFESPSFSDVVRWILIFKKEGEKSGGDV